MSSFSATRTKEDERYRTFLAMLRLMLTAVFVSVVLLGCNRENYSQPEAMLAEDMDCPEGSKGEFSRWGGIDENGWSHGCKMMHGKYHVWKAPS